MASGDVLYSTAQERAVMLIDAQAATGTYDGVWIDCAGYYGCTVTSIGGTGASVVEIDVNNVLAQPANNTHGVTHTTFAAGTNGQATLPVNFRWMKARISTLGTGTVTAIAILRTQKG